MSKITVKHYLNTRLKPEIEDKVKIYPLYLSITYDRMNIRTPSGIYNGIATTIKEGDIEKNKIEKQTLFKLKYEKDLIERCVIEFEKDEKTKNVKKNYYLIHPLKKYRSKNERLNILNSYIDFYTHSVFDVVSEEIKNKIKLKLLPKLDKEIKDFDLLDRNKIDILFRANTTELYKLIKRYKLGDEFETLFITWSRFYDFLFKQGLVYGYDMPFIDWLQGKNQPIFKEFLKTHSRLSDDWEKDLIDDEKANEMIEIIEKIVFNSNYLEKLTKLNNF